MSDATTAKLLLVALSFCWGLSWTAMRVALDEVSPWSLRLIGYSIGAFVLLILLKAQGRSLAIPAGKNWLHVFIAALFLAVGFGVAGTFAQLMANTSRVIIVNYSMPVWGSLMAYFVLHERINARSALGLALCVAGLSVLVYPVAETSLREPIGLLLAFVCALCWGGGTVYMKWARIRGDLLAITFWQVMVGVVVFAVFYLIFEGAPKLEPLQWRTWGGLLYNGILGTGIAYFIWFNIIGRLSTAMASLGSLINPVVGVIGAVIILGDRPTVPDMIGFALIFSAAACVMIPQRQKPPPDPA
ncbi:MAG TPA: DMT family transporter [Steroidobacteraceae bacterium]